MTTLHNKPAILAHPCPHCRAIPGQPCRSKVRRKTKPHMLRINAAKREAAPGECPACGMQLTITNRKPGHIATIHIGTSTFDCGPTKEEFHDYLNRKTSR